MKNPRSNADRGLLDVFKTKLANILSSGIIYHYLHVLLTLLQGSDDGLLHRLFTSSYKQTSFCLPLKAGVLAPLTALLTFHALTLAKGNKLLTTNIISGSIFQKLHILEQCIFFFFLRFIGSIF